MCSAESGKENCVIGSFSCGKNHELPKSRYFHESRQKFWSIRIVVIIIITAEIFYSLGQGRDMVVTSTARLAPVAAARFQNAARRNALTAAPDARAPTPLPTR